MQLWLKSKNASVSDVEVQSTFHQSFVILLLSVEHVASSSVYIESSSEQAETMQFKSTPQTANLLAMLSPARAQEAASAANPTMTGE
jgi:hypothetical protein